MVAFSTVARGAPLIVSLFNDAVFEPTNSNCLAQAYHGRFGQHVIFLPNEACFAAATEKDLLGGSLVANTAFEPREEHTLVWVEEAKVDRSVRDGSESFRKDLDAFLQALHRTSTKDNSLYSGSEQYMIGTQITPDPLKVLVDDAALLYLPKDIVNQLLQDPPRLWRPTPVPVEAQAYIPVPKDAVHRVRAIAHNMSFDPIVDTLVSSLNVKTMKDDIAHLTGESSTSDITSRHSFAGGARDAAQWLKSQFEHLGASCTLKSFLPGFAPNVICKYAGTRTPTEGNGTVILSAHYDSRGSFGSLRAPGGDDDGSGTTALLSIARAIYAHGLTFPSNVQLCLFAGEEQGLLGSKAHARELRSANANITLNIQADMLAYRKPGEPAQLGLPDLIGTPEVAQLVAKAAALYSPELSVGFTPACCSDHQSFHEQGFAATQVFERAGPIVDPMYHNSGDVSQREGYDFDQLKSIAKVQFATLLHAAGYEIPESVRSKMSMST